MERVLTSLYEKLRLTEDEHQEVDVGKEEVLLSAEKSKKCIAFSVVSDRQVNKGAVQNTMLKAWQVEGKAAIKGLGQNKFLLELRRLEDKERIMKGRPWSFDKHLICLQDCENVTSIKNVRFTEEAFWVQCHEIPFAGMNQKTGNDIGMSLGKVLNVDTDCSGICLGEYLRIKVLIDISKPLARGRFLKIEETKYWIPFKYERLPNFCFHCGLLKHSSGRCEMKELGIATGDGLEQQYGEWLRAGWWTSTVNNPSKGGVHGQVVQQKHHQVEKSGHDGSTAVTGNNVNTADNPGSADTSMEKIPGIQSIDLTQNHKESAAYSLDSVLFRETQTKEHLDGLLGALPLVLSTPPPIKPNQEQAQIVKFSPQKVVRDTGQAGGRTWKKRARSGPMVTLPSSDATKGYSEKHGVQKRKVIEESETSQAKRSRGKKDDELDLPMAEAAEQPCFSP